MRPSVGHSWCSRGSWAGAAQARHRPPTPGFRTRGQLPTPPSLGPAPGVATPAALWAGTAGASCPSRPFCGSLFCTCSPGPALSGSRSQLSLSLPQLPNLKVGSHAEKKTGSRATPTRAFCTSWWALAAACGVGVTASPLPQGGSGPQGWQPCAISSVQMALEAAPGPTPPSLPASSASQEERP